MENETTRVSLNYLHKIMLHALNNGTGKLRTLATPFFPDKLSSRIPLIIESPAVNVAFAGY